MLFAWTGWLSNPMLEVIIILHTEKTKAQINGILDQGCTNNWQRWDLNSEILTLARPVHLDHSIPLAIIDKIKINDKFRKAERIPVEKQRLTGTRWRMRRRIWEEQ